jgi:hypothetical protein
MSNQYVLPERFRAELRDALLGHAATRPVAGRAPTRRPHRVERRLLPAIALAAVATAAVLILRSGGALSPPPATASGVLNASAAAIDRLGESRALGPHEYFYVKSADYSNFTELGFRPYAVQSVNELWISRDGQGRDRYRVVRLYMRGLNRSLPGARSEDTRLRASAAPFVINPAPELLLSYKRLRRLPTDPAQLSMVLNRLLRESGIDRTDPRPAERDFDRLAILGQLAETPTSPALRATLYRLLAATPGVHLLGRVHDSAGRLGTAVAVDLDGVRVEMIIVPATGALLQMSVALLHRSPLYLDGREAPGLLRRDTYLSTAVVKSIHQQAP